MSPSLKELSPYHVTEHASRDVPADARLLHDQVAANRVTIKKTPYVTEPYTRRHKTTSWTGVSGSNDYVHQQNRKLGAPCGGVNAPACSLSWLVTRDRACTGRHVSTTESSHLQAFVCPSLPGTKGNYLYRLHFFAHREEVGQYQLKMCVLHSPQ